MTARPNWVRALYRFVIDDLYEAKYDYPADGSDDEIADRIEVAVKDILCAEYGHEIEMDMCGIPSHAYCVWCQRGVVDINHMAHAKVCSCLNDAAECCVESCPCPRVPHGGGQ